MCHIIWKQFLIEISKYTKTTLHNTHPMHKLNWFGTQRVNYNEMWTERNNLSMKKHTIWHIKLNFWYEKKNTTSKCISGYNVNVLRLVFFLPSQQIPNISTTQKILLCWTIFEPANFIGKNFSTCLTYWCCFVCCVLWRNHKNWRIRGGFLILVHFTWFRATAHVVAIQLIHQTVIHSNYMTCCMHSSYNFAVRWINWN